MENRCQGCNEPLSPSASGGAEDSSLSGLCETCRSAASEATYSSSGGGRGLRGSADPEQEGTLGAGGEDSNEQTSAYFPDQPRRIGHFELVSLLGKGGFGAVWRAIDTNLQRDVVVKLPKAFGRDANLRHEAQTAAKLKHPNIVAVYEVGEEDGQVYVASEFVEGNDLREELSNGRPSLARTVELVTTLARAVHHAHQSGVVHRDLKPANIIINDEGVPFITDFGMAKQISTEATISSEGQVVGTVSYMSPEQARGSSQSTDHRSDIYSLGVMLFEMLTDNRPFRGNARAVLHQKIYEDAPSPRKLAPQLPKDLATICLKCLEREPGARYKSAEAVAEELERFTRNEPILARPISAPEKLWRWCKRRPAVAGLISGIILTLSFALLGITHFWREAVQQAEQTKQSLYRSEIALAGEYWKSGDIAAMRRTLAEYDTDEHQQWRGFEHNYFQQVLSPFGAIVNHGDVLTDVAIAADHKYMASVGNDRAIRIWSTSDGKLLRTLALTSRCVAIHCSPKDGRLASLQNDGIVRLWNPLQHDREIKSLPPLSGATAFAWSPEGEAIVVAGRSGAQWIRVANGEVAWRSNAFNIRVKAVSVAGDGRVAVGLQSGDVRLLTDAAEPQSISLSGNRGLETLAFAPDGKELSVGCFDGSIRLWNVSAKPQEIANVSVHVGVIGDIEFLEELDQWASVGVGGDLILCNRAGRTTRSIPTHNLSFGRLAKSANGQRLVVGGGDGSVKQLKVADLAEPSVFWFDSHVRDVKFLSQDHIVVCTGDGAITQLDLGSNTSTELAPSVNREILRLATNPQRSSALAAAGMIRELIYWADSNESKKMSTANLPLAGYGAIALSGDGSWLAAGSRGGELRLHHLKSGQLSEPTWVRQFEEARINAVCFADDSQRVFVATSKNSLLAIDVVTQKEFVASKLPAEPLAIATVAGRVIVGTQSGELLYLNGEDLTVQHRRKAHSSRINAVAVFPDGSRVVSAGRDHALRIWDASSGDRLASLPGHGRQIFGVAISPDGLTIASAGLAGDVRIWRSEPPNFQRLDRDQ